MVADDVADGGGKWLKNGLHLPELFVFAGVASLDQVAELQEKIDIVTLPALHAGAKLCGSALCCRSFALRGEVDIGDDAEAERMIAFGVGHQSPNSERYFSMNSSRSPSSTVSTSKRS